MSTPPDAPSVDFLRDRSTQFRLRMAFLVGHHYEDQYHLQEHQTDIKAWFQLRFPDDQTQEPWLDFQLQEQSVTHYTAPPVLPGTDAFLPRSRRLSAEGLRGIFSWIDEVNLWEWRPPEPPPHFWHQGREPTACGWRYPNIDPFYALDPLFRESYPSGSEAEIVWFLEVSRGGRCFRHEFMVNGAPAPSAYAFEEGAWTLPTCREVAILPNHLIFLTNDPIIVGLTKRLLRLLPKKKPRKQVAEFDDGRGTRYELDFDRMVARKVAKNFGLGLGPWGFLPSKTQEVPMTEFDRMRFWAILLEFKSTPEGFRPTGLLDNVKDQEPSFGKRGRRWSAKVCDGKHSHHYKKGFIVPDDKKLCRRFREAFESPFLHGTARSEIDPLPRVDLPVSQYVPGGVPAMPPPEKSERADALIFPLSGREWAPYEDAPEDRLRRYVEEARLERNDACLRAAFMGDIESMLVLARWESRNNYERRAHCVVPWYVEAAQCGSLEAMVGVGHGKFGIIPESARSLLELSKISLEPSRDAVRLAALASDADGLGRRYYETAYKAGYRPAALGLGFLYEYGIGVPQDLALAVAYYREYLGDLGEVIEESQVFACSRLRNLYNGHQTAAPVRNYDERDWFDALIGVYRCKKAAGSARWKMDAARNELVRKDKDYADALSRWIALKERRSKGGS